MIKNVFSIVRNIEIRIAVIVVVTDGYAHAIVSVSNVRQTGLLGHVCETSVFVLTVQTIPVTRVMTLEVFRGLHLAGDVPAVDKEDIQQPVVVVVKKGYSTRHGFDQIFLRSRGVL